MVLCLVTLTDLQTRRAGLSAIAEFLVCIVDSNKHFLIGKFTEKYTETNSYYGQLFSEAFTLFTGDTGGQQEGYVTCKTSSFSNFQRFSTGNSWGTVSELFGAADESLFKTVLSDG